LFLASCSPPPEAPSGDNPRERAGVYDTEEPLPALDYSILFDKETGLVLHALSTHMATALQVERGEYPVSDEIKNVERSTASVEEAIVSINNAHPAKTYEDDRLEFLRLAGNAKATLEVYREALVAGDKDMINAAHGLMKGDYTALSGLFNVMWE
jgi:hypothetical protein